MEPAELPPVNVQEALLAEQPEGYRKRQMIRIQLTEEYEG